MSILKKLTIAFSSFLFTLVILEVIFRLLNFPPQLQMEYRRKDLEWTGQHVNLNSYGYRDREFSLEKGNSKLRIYSIGDSYTYGWLIDNPENSFPKLIEKSLNESGDGKIEVINAASPGFTIKEIVERFIYEGKYFYPDLVIIGINDDESNVSSTYFPPADVKFPQFIKSSRVYQATLGIVFAKRSENQNHDYIVNIYKNENSQDWKNFTDYLLKLKSEADKINAKVAIVIYPHIHANNPNKDYDFYEYNGKLKKFAQDNNISVIDPLDNFLKYPQKEKLVINPIDPHPTIEMNSLVAGEIINQFDFKSFIEKHKRFYPTKNVKQITKSGDNIGAFNRVASISSNISGHPWVYFESKNGTDPQRFPLIGLMFRQTKFHADYLQTVRSFTHTGQPGATMNYYSLSTQKGQLKIPVNLYNYNVIGISYILALEVAKDGATRGTYIKPSTIIKSPNEWIIDFEQTGDFQIYQTNLKVGVRQLDIRQDGTIENISQSRELRQTIVNTTEKVVFPLNQKIVSWARFEDFEGGGFDYALVNNKVTKLKSVKVEELQLVLSFEEPLQIGDIVSINISDVYLPSSGEKILVNTQ